MVELKREDGELAKVVIKKTGDSFNDYEIYVNGVDISTWVTDVRVDLSSLAVPIVWLAVISNPEFEGEIDAAIKQTSAVNGEMFDYLDRRGEEEKSPA